MARICSNSSFGFPNSSSLISSLLNNNALLTNIRNPDGWWWRNPSFPAHYGHWGHHAKIMLVLLHQWIKKLKGEGKPNYQNYLTKTRTITQDLTANKQWNIKLKIAISINWGSYNGAWHPPKKESKRSQVYATSGRHEVVKL